MSLPFFLKWTIYGQFLYLIVVQGGLNEIFLFGREEGFQLNGQYIQEGNSLHVVVLPLNCRLDNILNMQRCMLRQTEFRLLKN